MSKSWFWGLFAALASNVNAQSPQTQDEIVARALAQHPSIGSARQKLQEAQAHVAEMSAQRRFQFILSGSLSGSSGTVAQPPTPQSFATGEASLNAPIPNLGRAGAQVDQAEAAVEATRMQLLRAQLDVEFRASQAYVELLKTREAVQIAQDSLDQSTRQAQDTQKRIDAGDLPASDLLKAQVPVAQNRAALARAKIAASVARQNLNDLLQQDLEAPLDVAALSATASVSLGIDEAVALAMRQSPDILEATANLRGARDALAIARHAKDLDLSVQLTHSRTSDPTAYSQLTTLALNFSLPLSDAGVGSAQIRQAQAQVAQAETALRVARQAVRLAVQQALLDVQGNEADVEATAQTLEIARQSLEKARQAYAAGLTTTRDVLDAQFVYNQSRVEANAALYTLAVSRARLKQLLGGTLP